MAVRDINKRFFPSWMYLLIPGALGGMLGAFIGAPMPYLIGALVFTAATVIIHEQYFKRDKLNFPKQLRWVFIAIIGTMIGSNVDDGFLLALVQFWPSILALVPFVVLAHLGNYAIMRRLGRQDKLTALYTSMPGGLVEAVIMGERAGGNVAQIIAQHFLRILIVVIVIPLGFWLTTGMVVGSADGQGFSRAPSDMYDLVEILLISAVGYVIGRRTHIPAGHLMGPLILCATLQIIGVVDVISPMWLFSLAQFMIGVGLGAQFSGLSVTVVLRSLGTGIVSLVYMLILALGFALGLRFVVPEGVAGLLIAFAPGGVTEMSLIALGLQISPAIIVTHHLVRIILTVMVVGLVARLLKIKPKNTLAEKDNKQNQPQNC